MIFDSTINQLDSMYPSEGHMVTSAQSLTLPTYTMYSSIYGYTFGPTEFFIDGKARVLEGGQYFAFFVKNSCTVTATNKAFVVVRLGYKVVDQIGWVEERGRLSYIDGCSDSLLVYPSRMGDGSLNFLYFPPGISQTFHLHPSIRIGCVVAGHGFSDWQKNGDPITSDLAKGNIFCLNEQETHRFKTTTSSMTVIVWHPDGDWGPTDHNHTMLNRTYIQK